MDGIDMNQLLTTQDMMDITGKSKYWVAYRCDSGELPEVVESDVFALQWTGTIGRLVTPAEMLNVSAWNPPISGLCGIVVDEEQIKRAKRLMDESPLEPKFFVSDGVLHDLP